MTTTVETEEAELARWIAEAEQQIARLDPQLVLVRMMLEARLSCHRRRRDELATLNATVARGEG